MAHYLDDFIRVIPKKEADSIPQAFKDYIEFTDALGIFRNDSRDRCGTVVEVLGIEIDIIKFIARLSHDKLQETVMRVTVTLQHDSLTLKEAQSLAGYLSYCCKVVRLGRAFLSSAWEF